jgi:Mor family transcriptional regulator
MPTRPSQSAGKILPERLLKEIQQYCSGCWLYIPKQRKHARMGRKYRILLYHEQGRPTAEIARLVDCTPRYVRWVLAQDRQRADAFQQQFGGAPDADA